VLGDGGNVPVAGGLKCPEKYVELDPLEELDEPPDNDPRAGKAECGRCQLGLVPEKLPDAVAKGDGGGS
jgi:hypothetical protein